RLATVGEGVVPVDEDRRRAPHPEPLGLLRRVNRALPNGRHQLHPGQGQVHEIAGGIEVGAVGNVEQVDVHGATVRLPVHWKVKGKEMLIGEVADRSGVSTKAIRYYEDIGLLPPPERTASGYRDYAASVVDRLAFIRAAQAVGLSLGEIRGVVALRDEGQ